MFEDFMISRSFNEDIFQVNFFEYPREIDAITMAQFTLEGIKRNLTLYNINNQRWINSFRNVINNRRSGTNVNKNNGTDIELLCNGILKDFFQHQIWGAKVSLESPDKGYDIISYCDNYQRVNISEVKSNLSNSYINIKNKVCESFYSMYCANKQLNDQVYIIGEEVNTEDFGEKKMEDFNVLTSISAHAFNDNDISYDIVNNNVFTINIINAHKYDIEANHFTNFEQFFENRKCIRCNKSNNCDLFELINNQGIIINFYHIDISDTFTIEDYFNALEQEVNDYE